MRVDVEQIRQCEQVTGGDQCAQGSSITALTITQWLPIAPRGMLHLDTANADSGHIARR